MADFNRGEVITIEAELKEYTPFGDHALTDADSLPTITIRDSSNKIKISVVDMVNSVTGKYYYLCQTASDWALGDYQIKIVSVYNAIPNTHIKDKAFKLG